jgi:erythromycin esterase-like protein
MHMRLRRVGVAAVLAAGLGVASPAEMASPPDASEVAGFEAEAAARVADAVCDKSVVLLGELPDHGEARGFGVKAEVVRQLVTRCGFQAVLFEAGSYDFFGVERAIASGPPAAVTDELDLRLARAIGAFWWTRDLADWRRWLAGEALAGRVSIGGIDDQPSATAAHARETLPGLVGDAVPAGRQVECGTAVTRYVNWSYTDAHPYDDAEKARLADCTRSAAKTSTASAESAERVMLDDIANYFAREGGAAGAGAAKVTDRDQAMAEHVEWWTARLPPDSKIIVWTATTHAARGSDAPTARPLGVMTMGARLAARFRDRLATIGFTALRGEWARAGRPAQPLVPLPADSLEARALATGSDAPAVPAPWAFLDREALRSIGAAPSRLFGRPSSNDWSAAFDGVLVIRDEAAPVFDARR